MGLIDDEVNEVNNNVGNIILNSKLITCLPSLIRIDINHTPELSLTVCLRFPNNYPNDILLIELKSRKLSSKLLDGIIELCDKKLKTILGKAQVILILKFINDYLIENPLCIIYDEIRNLKILCKESQGSEIKVKQKQYSVKLVACGGKYFFKINVNIEKEYPSVCCNWIEYTTNLPDVLVRYLNGQSKEIARQCVEKPLRLVNINDVFQPKPSLEKALSFIIIATREFSNELCPVCNLKCLPDNPVDIDTNDASDKFIERVYCGHIFHQGCLKKYLREPPFPKGGKLCPAVKKHPRSDNMREAVHNKSGKCLIRLSHDRWNNNPKLAEARWAHQQARERELDEVIDFLQ